MTANSRGLMRFEHYREKVEGRSSTTGRRWKVGSSTTGRRWKVGTVLQEEGESRFSATGRRWKVGPVLQGEGGR